MKHLLLSRFFCAVLISLLPLIATAQKLQVVSLKPLANDASARTNKVVDDKGVTCALIKVPLPIKECKFGVNVYKQSYKANEYWVYVPNGCKQLLVKCPGRETLRVNLATLEGGKGVKSGATYSLKLSGYGNANTANTTNRKDGFKVAPPPPADAPEVTEILDVVDDDIDVDEIINTLYDNDESTISPTEPTKTKDDDDEVFEVVEQNPQFPGGDQALMAWITKNLKYPSVAKENGIQGRVMVSFVVNKDGSISDTKITRSVDPSLDKEAIRLVYSMPKWTPGRQKGKNVRVKYSLPVTFRLQ